MNITLSVAKINKFSSPDSGDTLEVIERPNGGLSVVLANGLLNGQSSKFISSKVVHTAIGLLMEGIRDGAVARAASDRLFTEFTGKASAHLNIISVDLQTQTILIVQNTPLPIYVARGERLDVIQTDSIPIGTSRNISPIITEISLENNLWVIMHSFGMCHTGQISTQNNDFTTSIESLLEEQEPSADELTNAIITEAIRLDQGRPCDNISVVALKTTSQPTDMVRRMTVHMPVENTTEETTY